MGLIALVAGYLYRFRWRANLLVVLGAVLLGYVFNFVRLCVLVLFYLVALHFPWLQDRAENADYLIGAALFFVAVYLLYIVIQHLGSKPGAEPASVVALPQIQPEAAVVEPSFYPRVAALSVLVALGLFSVIQQMHAGGPSAELLADETAFGQFPESVGNFTLVRRWNENLLTGALLFHWAEYAPAGGGTHISLGVSPVLGSHDTLVCHTARGEDPIWHGQQTFPTAGGLPVAFSSSFYNDGTTQYMEATTLCSAGGCGEHTTNPGYIGLVFSRPHPETLLSQNAARPIPILLRAETADTTLPVDTARSQLGQDLTSFLSAVSLEALTRPYRRQ